MFWFMLNFWAWVEFFIILIIVGFFLTLVIGTLWRLGEHKIDEWRKKK